MMKERLVGKTLTELDQIALELGLPRYTGKQLASWLYDKRVNSVDEMTNLSRQARTRIDERYTVGWSLPCGEALSSDGTAKYLFAVGDGQKYIESVYIPDKTRATLCVSSQIGCKMNCYFCMTGKQGFSGNLSAAEIINQVVSVPHSRSLTNLVFMGMGEPADNVEEVLKAVEIHTAPWGFGWSPKRFTISSIGLQKGLQRLLEQCSCHIAISLHSPYHLERESLMPVEKANPLSSVIPLLKRYDFSGQRRISFEYILFKGLNDSPAHAKELVRILAGIPCRVNLIRFHAIPGVDLQTSDMQAMEQFRDYLSSHRITCTIRASRGEDILAACGMLSTLKNKK